MKSIRCIHDSLVYENKYIQLYDDDVLFPSGKSGTYIRFRYRGNPPGVVIIARTLDNKLLLLDIHRYASGEISCELPRGSAEIDEPIETAAMRELEEETGLKGKSCKILGYTRPDTAIVETMAAICEVELDEDSTTSIKVEAEEGIERATFVSLEELKHLAKKGKITDGFTLAAIAYLLLSE